MAGFSQGGGVGLSLANWMVEGDPGADIWAMDVARYGDWATRPYTNAKVRENYSRRFRIRFPNEELEAARPLRTTPIYEKLQAENAVFGDYCTLEHALVVRAARARRRTKTRRSAGRTPIRTWREECRAVREACGLIEISNYGKFEITGPGRRRLAGEGHGVQGAGRGPHRAVADAERAWPADRRFHAVPRRGRALLRRRHVRRRSVLHALVRAAPAADRRDACVRARWNTWACRSPGPQSRALLQKLVDDDLSTAAFPFMSFAQMDVGTIPALVGRVSFTGDLGYEIWVTSEYLRALYDLLRDDGQGARPASTSAAAR